MAPSSRWSLKGQSFIVTGGSKGIGKAVVKSLVEHEASTVIFCSRSEIHLSDYLVSLGVGDSSVVKHVMCDVSTDEGRKELVKKAREILGGNKLQGLINNVGINVRKPILEQTAEEYHSMRTTNVDAAYFLCRECSDLFDTEGASIVNVSSAAGVQSSGTGASYGMTKAALNHFTRILACEWASRKIRVNAVTPWMTVSKIVRFECNVWWGNDYRIECLSIFILFVIYCFVSYC